MTREIFKTLTLEISEWSDVRTGLRRLVNSYPEDIGPSFKEVQKRYRELEEKISKLT